MNVHTFLQTAPLFRIFLLLITGVLSGEYIFNNISPVTVIITLIPVLAVTMFLRKSAVIQSAMLLFAVFLTGLCVHRISVNNMTFVEKGWYDYRGVVTSSVKHNEKNSSFDLTMLSGKKDLKIRATIKGNIILYPGDRLHISSKINPPEDRNDKGFSFADYLKRNGYAGSTFIDKRNIIFEGNRYDDLTTWMRIKIYLLQMRSSLLAHLHDEGLSGRDFATVSAMAFGDKTYLSNADKEMYSHTGVSHVLALSGLHIGIIYAFLAFFMTFVPRIPKFIVIQAAIWFYVVFAGMSPSLIRAALMITIYSLGTLIHRDKISVNSLSLAGTISVLVSPQIVFDLCFQLSFISVFSILLFYHPITKCLPSHPLVVQKIMQMIAVSVAAYVGTMPLIIYHFESISCCFILTNLVVVPLTTAIIYLALLSFLPIAGTFIADALILVVSITNGFVSLLSELKFTNISGIHFTIYTVILTYVIIFSIYLIYCKLSSSKNIDSDL